MSKNTLRIWISYLQIYANEVGSKPLAVCLCFISENHKSTSHLNMYPNALFPNTRTYSHTHYPSMWMKWMNARKEKSEKERERELKKKTMWSDYICSGISLLPIQFRKLYLWCVDFRFLEFIGFLFTQSYLMKNFSNLTNLQTNTSTNKKNSKTIHL